MNGVIETNVGYMGGDEKRYPKPTYKQVCTDKTGYAEIIQIKFDEKKVSYEKLLELFWSHHNPTTLNKQDLDEGTQYRSAIFYCNKKQKKIAEESMMQEQKKIKKKIVTRIVLAKTFFKAEEYHQKYLQKTKGAVCSV